MTLNNRRRKHFAHRYDPFPMTGRIFTWAAPIFMLFLMWGCSTVGPDYKAPELSVAPQWTDSNNPRIKVKSVDHSKWWNTFDDPTLTRLIGQARAQNLPLRAAAIRILEARAHLGRAVGSLYPQVQEGFGSYSRIKLNGNANPVPLSSLPFAGDLSGTFNNYQIGLGALWELDLWGRFRRGVEAADAAYIASVATYDDLLVSLTADVAITYVTIRTIEERLIFAQRNVELQQESLRIAESRFRNGATSELDVSQAQTLLGVTQALVPKLRTALRHARNALATLVGKRINAIDVLLGGAGSIPTAPESVAIGIPADLIRRRPDIRLAELQAIAQCARIGMAKGELLPRLGIGGAFGLSAANAADLFSSGSTTGFISPFFTWNILNYGRIVNNVRAQDAQYQTLLVHYQHTVLVAQREVEDAVAGFLGARERVELLNGTVTAAERSEELALDQYRQGAASYTRLLESQMLLSRQQDHLTEVRGEVCVNLIGIYRSLGGGWQLRDGKPVIPEETLSEMRDRTGWGGLLEKAKEAPTRNAEPSGRVRLPDMW